MLDFIIRNQFTLLFLLGFAISLFLCLIIVVYYMWSNYLMGAALSIAFPIHSFILLPKLSLAAVALPLIISTVLSIGLPVDIIDRTYRLKFPIPETVSLHDATIMYKRPSNLLIFIHGWRGDPEETWRKFPGLVHTDRRLSHRIDVLVIDYPTSMWGRTISVIEFSKWINKKLDSTQVWKSYEKVAVIAHSMGGIIAREIAILRELARRDHSFGVLVEVASPHKGANYAKLASSLGIGEPITEELSINSPFLNKLQAQWEALKQRPTTHCYTSIGDKIVLQDSAIFQCDKTLIHPNRKWGHKELVKPGGHEDVRYAMPIDDVILFIQEGNEP